MPVQLHNFAKLMITFKSCVSSPVHKQTRHLWIPASAACTASASRYLILNQGYLGFSVICRFSDPELRTKSALQKRDSCLSMLRGQSLNRLSGLVLLMFCNKTWKALKVHLKSMPFFLGKERDPPLLAINRASLLFPHSFLVASSPSVWFLRC